MIEGIDVSYWQGRIDWPKVAAAGKKFAIIRSGDGTFLDPLFEQNIVGAVDAGLIVEPYHYMRFALQPDVHADILWHRLEVAKNLGARPRMWLDWEDEHAGCTEMMLSGRLDWLLELLDSLGPIRFGHYTRASWFNHWLDGAAGWPDFSEHPLWVAHYGADAPTLPWGWDNWLIWQYTSKGHCPGIEGYVDLNVAKDSFMEEDMDRVELDAILKAKDEGDKLEWAARGAVADKAFAAVLSALTGHWENLKGNLGEIQAEATRWHRWEE